MLQMRAESLFHRLMKSGSKAAAKRTNMKRHVKGVLEIYTRTHTLREFEQITGVSHGNAISFQRGGGASEPEMGRIITQLYSVGELRLAEELLLAHCLDHIPVGHEKDVCISLVTTSVRESSPRSRAAMLAEWVMGEIFRNPAVYDLINVAYILAHGPDSPQPPQHPSAPPSKTKS